MQDLPAGPPQSHRATGAKQIQTIGENMSSNHVAILPVKEILKPFTGRQMLEKAIEELRLATRATDLMQVVILTPEQLQLINKRAAAADYFIQKVQRMVVGLEAYDSRNERNKLTLLINELHDFAIEAKEPGDDDGTPS